MSRDQIFKTSGSWSSYKPFHLARAEGESHSWIGGDPPEGILPPLVTAKTRYLGTLRLEGEKSVSMFTNVDFYGGIGPWSPWQKPLYTQAEDLVQFVVHAPTIRPNFVSTAIYDPRPADIVFGPQGENGNLLSVNSICEAVIGLSDRVYTGHKSGGIPTFFQLPSDILNAAVETMSEGFFHLLQLGFLEYDDTETSTSYEFGENVFHVYVRAKDTEPYFEFRYHWG